MIKQSFRWNTTVDMIAHKWRPTIVMYVIHDVLLRHTIKPFVVSEMTFKGHWDGPIHRPHYIPHITSYWYFVVTVPLYYTVVKILKLTVNDVERCFHSITTPTSSSAVAKRPRDASCLSVVSFNSRKRRVESSSVSYICYRFITACN